MKLERITTDLRPVVAAAMRDWEFEMPSDEQRHALLKSYMLRIYDQLEDIPTHHLVVTMSQILHHCAHIFAVAQDEWKRMDRRRTL